MLGSVSEAEDAVQEAWLRLSRSDADEVDNLGGWLTTVVGRVCLDMLRARTLAARGLRRDAGCPSRSSADDDDGRPRAGGAARRLRRARAARRARDADARRAAGLRAARHVRRAVRRDRADRRPVAGRRAPAREPGAAPRARARRQRPTPTWRGSARSSTRSSPPRAAATSRRCSRCSTPTSSSASTPARPARSRAPPITGAEPVARQILARGSRFAPLARPAPSTARPA